MLKALMMMTSPTRLRTGLWAVCALALGATTVAGYLAWATWNSSPIVGCGEQSLFDCSEVITGKWSKWLGMPVSFLGAVDVWPAAGGVVGYVRLGTSTQFRMGLALPELVSAARCRGGNLVFRGSGVRAGGILPLLLLRPYLGSGDLPVGVMDLATRRSGGAAGPDGQDIWFSGRCVRPA